MSRHAKSDWLVVWNMFYFSVIYGIILPIDELLFFRGVRQRPTRLYSIYTCFSRYPPVICYIATENGRRNLGFTHQTCRMDRTEHFSSFFIQDEESQGSQVRNDDCHLSIDFNTGQPLAVAHLHCWWVVWN